MRRPNSFARATAFVLVFVAAVTACGRTRPAEPARSPAARGVTFRSLAPDVYRPCGIAPSRDAVWVLSCAGKAVRVGADDARVARPIDGEIVGLDSLAGDGSASLWITTATGSGKDRRGAVVPLDAVSRQPGRPIDLGPSVPMHAVSVGGTAWVATIDGGLFILDGETARRVGRGSPLLWIVADDSVVWTVAENGDVLERGPDGAAKRTYAGVLPNSHAAAAGEGSVWLAAESGVVRVDGSTGVASRIDVAGTVNSIEACGGSVWLSQPDFGLRSLDASGNVVRNVSLDTAPSYLACDGRTLWILTEDGGLGSIDTTK